MSGILPSSDPTSGDPARFYFPLTNVDAEDQYGVLVPTIDGEIIIRRVTGFIAENEFGFLALAADGEKVGVTGVPGIVEIDFLLIRYTWESSGGTDLDTRTWVNDPPIDFVVGWARGASDDYITWGGDNTSPAGTEAVLVDVSKLIDDYPSQDVISVRTGAFWYGGRVSGNITVTLLAYKGGTMQRVGTDFVNVGGEETTRVDSPRNVALQTRDSASDGEFLGNAIYNITDKTFVYTSP